ncbi:aKG-HExxH-type peptide beta-hydroxylase [Nocardia gipuzkoensis]
MYFLNIAHAYENVSRFAAVMTGEQQTVERLGAGYRRGFAAMRPFAAPETGWSVSFEDGLWGEYLIANNIFDGIFVGVTESSPGQRARWHRLLAEAAQSVRDLDPNLGRVVDLLVTDIVLLNSERTGGGSASHLPGLVCMSPAPSWEASDFAQSLVHEAIHLNLFIADMVHGLYTLPASELAADEYRVLSAVKIGELRPLDKAFHAAVVAVPLMYMEHHWGRSELVDQFTASLRDATEGLCGKLEYFTDYGQVLVGQLRDFAVTLDFDVVAEAISGSKFASYRTAA